mmetsp:Transcript_23744/g.38095  ORF Transcript_23744/g.38095 Transcript_23744/m.38095 type:complete len:139 (-) Transcript_23744:61-477(-)
MATAASLLSRVQGYLDRDEIRREIQSYVESAAQIFAGFTEEQLMADGGEAFDQRHDWHASHQGFVELLERRLDEALASEGIDRAAFEAECRSALETPDQATTFDRMIVSMLVESGDYTKFVTLVKMYVKMDANTGNPG